MQLEGSRFLVTGGCGFIGSHLVRRLLGAGAGVVVFDNALRPTGGAGDGERLRLMQGDLRRPDDLRRAAAGCAGIFHLAVLDIGGSARDPRACLEINVDGTFNIVEAARDAGAQKVVFSSASSVYGDTLETMDESHPLGARTMYGASKIGGEYFLRAFHSMCGLDYVTLRYMNVYGPGQQIGVIPAVLRRLKSGEPPVIFGDGSQSFDYVYVDDVAAANVRAMESDVSDEVFNIGSGEERTVKQVVEALLALTGSPLQPEYRRDEQVPMQRRVGSSKKAARLLGWRAAVSLDEGLRRVVQADYFEAVSYQPSAVGPAGEDGASPGH